MKNLFTILLLLITLLSYSQEVTVEFFKQGKEIRLNSNFKIYFVFGDSTHRVIVKPRIKGNKFQIPNLCEKKEGFILFEYKNRVYKIGKRGVMFTQNMRWVFAYDTKPYNREYHNKGFHEKEVKGIFYLEFHPQEFGDGVVTATTFEDKKNFLKYGKALIYD